MKRLMPGAHALRFRMRRQRVDTLALDREHQPPTIASQPGVHVAKTRPIIRAALAG